MKKTIRRNCFETNSSSVHAIAIGKNISDKPDTKIISFCLGEFGWEYQRYSSLEERASYLYTGILEVCCTDLEDWVQYIKDTLEPYGVQCVFVEPLEKSWCYIDHSEDLTDWLTKLRNNPDMLVKFLLSPDSEIHTGNDNTEGCCPRKSQYDDPDKYEDVYMK